MSYQQSTSNFELSKENLKKLLDWELSLDSRDIRSHGWFHGTITRPQSEDLLKNEGHFLVRESSSRAGDYVLSCRWRGAPLHFLVNRVTIQPNTVYERIQYQFEDECFDTIADLVTFYVGNRRRISAATGAVISSPLNRSFPLQSTIAASSHILLQTSIEATGVVATNGATVAPPKPSRVRASNIDVPPGQGVRSNITTTNGRDRTTNGSRVEHSTSILKERPTVKITPINDDVKSYFNENRLESMSNAGSINDELDASCANAFAGTILDCSSRNFAQLLTVEDIKLLHLSGASDLGMGCSYGLEILSLPQGAQLRSDLLERKHCLSLFVCATILLCEPKSRRVDLLSKWISIAFETKASFGNLFAFQAITCGLLMPQISRLEGTWLELRQRYTDVALSFETGLGPTIKLIEECEMPQAPNTCIPAFLTFIDIFEQYETIMDNEKHDKYQRSINVPWSSTTVDFGLGLLLVHLEQPYYWRSQCAACYAQNATTVLRHHAGSATYIAASPAVSADSNDNTKMADLSSSSFSPPPNECVLTECHRRFLWGAKFKTLNELSLEDSRKIVENSLDSIVEAMPSK